MNKCFLKERSFVQHVQAIDRIIKCVKDNLSETLQPENVENDIFEIELIEFEELTDILAAHIQFPKIPFYPNPIPPKMSRCFINHNTSKHSNFHVNHRLKSLKVKCLLKFPLRLF